MYLLDIEDPCIPLSRDKDREVDLAVGIDFGTTNSVVGFCSSDGAVSFVDDGISVIIPSIMAIHQDGEQILIGHQALEKLGDESYAVMRSIKRLIPLVGKKADLTTMNLGCPISVDDNNNYLLDIFGRKRSLEDCISYFLGQLKLLAEKSLSAKIAKAVITVPAYFDDISKNIVKSAASKAGLGVLRLIPEPTAAALGYGFDNSVEGIYVVYDLGGGTFDVSILRIQEGVHQVLAVGGCDALGGDDFDNLIVDMMCKAFGSHHKKSDLHYMARDIKHQLSELEHCVLQVPASYGDVGSWSITRSEFEEAACPLVQRTIDVMQEAIKLAMEKESNLTISGAIFVGSSTRMPIIERMVEQCLGQQISLLKDADRDRVVAMGAALKASQLNYGNTSCVLIDVVPLSIGLESIGGVVEKMIPRNTPVPVVVEQEFTTFQNNQTGIVVNVVQGERELVADCRPLNSFVFKVEPAPAGKVKLLVRFSVDLDGILTVSAMDQSTGLKQEVQICPSHGLSLDKVQDMLTSSIQHAGEDISRRLLLSAGTKLEKLIEDTKCAIAQDKECLSDEQVEIITDAIQKAQLALTESGAESLDIAHLKGVTSHLEKVTEDFANKRLLRALKKFYEQ